MMHCSNESNYVLKPHELMVSSCVGALITSLFSKTSLFIKITFNDERSKYSRIFHRIINGDKIWDQSKNSYPRRKWKKSKKDEMGCRDPLRVTPFDVVKVRLQAQQKALMSQRCYLYCNGLMDHICQCSPFSSNLQSAKPEHVNGTVDAFIKISRSEGLHRLWSGLPPTLVIAIPMTVVYFTTYEQLRQFVITKWSTSGMPPFWAGAVAGSAARTWSVTVASPFELIRTKMQSKTLSYREVITTLKGEVKQHGVCGLWRGWAATIFRDVPFSAIYWTSYENLKKLVRPEELTIMYTFIAGAISGGVAGILTLPLDVVKTHQQIEIGEEILSDKKKKKNAVQSQLFSIYKQQGVRGLFAGIVPRLAKVMPACAIMISTYEYAKRHFRIKRDLEARKIYL